MVNTTATDEQYGLLGVQRNCEPEEVKKAYHSLVRTAHPDKGGNLKLWDDLQKAYRQVLYETENPSSSDSTRTHAWVVEGPFAGCKVKIISETEATFKIEVVSIPDDDEHKARGILVGTSRFVKKDIISFHRPGDTSQVPSGAAAKSFKAQEALRLGVEYQVVFKRVVVRTAPSLSGDIDSILLEGAKFLAVEVQGDWAKMTERKWVMIRHPEHGTLLEPTAKGAMSASASVPITKPAATTLQENVVEVEKPSDCNYTRAAAQVRSEAEDSHPLGHLFLPGKLPNFFTGVHEKFFPPCRDEVISEANLGLLTQAVNKVLEDMREKNREMEMDSQIDEFYEEGDFDGSSRIPNVTWTCLSDFPYQYPKKWIFLRDFLETTQGMPVKYPDSGYNYEWNFSDKKRAWANLRSLEEILPYIDKSSRQALEYADKIIAPLSRIMRADTYGNIISPFAKKGAIGDFEFDSFAPRARVGAVADAKENCTVACCRLHAWKGYLIPNFIPPEYLLCGLSGFKMRLILNGLKAVEAVPNPVEVVLGYIPNGDPEQPELRIRTDMDDPLVGFQTKDDLAYFLQQLHWLCEPESAKMSGFNSQASMVKLVQHFSDDSPRGDYIHVQYCSLCDGEQPYYKLPLGSDLEESPGKCRGYTCENCEFLKYKFFVEELEKDRVLECRLGVKRDREKWAAISASYENQRRMQQKIDKELSRMLNPRLDLEKAEAEEMVATLREIGRHGDANELQKTLDSEDDTDSEPEMMDVF